jgi:hypothetical protein
MRDRVIIREGGRSHRPPVSGSGAGQKECLFPGLLDLAAWSISI